MNRYLGILSASLATFAVTNIDDAFLRRFSLPDGFRSGASSRVSTWGFATIIVVSLIAALAALAIPHRWIRMLGILPLAIGIRDLLRDH